MASTLDALQQIHASLKAHCLAAQARVALSFTAPSGIRSALQMDAERIKRLDPVTGDLGKSVLNGTLTPEKWKAIAESTWEDINAQLKYFGEGTVSFSRLWSEVIIPSAQTVKEGVNTALPFAGAGLFLLAALYVFLLVRR